MQSPLKLPLPKVYSEDIWLKAWWMHPSWMHPPGFYPNILSWMIQHNMHIIMLATDSLWEALSFSFCESAIDSGGQCSRNCAAHQVYVFSVLHTEEKRSKA